MFGDVKELYLKNTYSGGGIIAAGGLDRSTHPINSYIASLIAINKTTKHHNCIGKNTQ